MRISTKIIPPFVFLQIIKLGTVMDFKEEQAAWAKVGLDFHQYKVDLELEGYPENLQAPYIVKVNGAVINQDKKDAFLDLDNLTAVRRNFTIN